MSLRAFLLASTIVAASAGLAAPGQAATAADQATDATANSGTAIQEVVVTARRTSENNQKVPIAVTVVTAQELQRRNIEQAIDLTTVTPGLAVQPATTNRFDGTFTIRGQGSSSFSGGSGVVTYLNEVPDFGNGPTGSGPIFDIDNVQILKGPQGTLFGRVTTGGAVLFTPTAPTDEFRGYVNFRTGKWDYEEVQFGVGGPIVPGMLSFRIAGLTRNGGGWVTNLYNGERTENQNNRAFRATLLFQDGPIKNTTLYQYQWNRDDERSQFLVQSQNVGNIISGFQQPIPAEQNAAIPAQLAALNGISCTPVCPTWHQVQQNVIALERGEKGLVYDNFSGPSQTALTQGIINSTDFKVNDELTLRNIFSYRNSNTPRGGENPQDASPLPQLEVINVPNTHGTNYLSEEFQAQADPISTLHVTAGVFYEHVWDPWYNTLVTSTYGGFLGPGFSYIGYLSQLSKSDTANEAVYAQGVWKILPNLSITGGYRFTRAEATSWSTGYIPSIQEDGLLAGFGMPPVTPPQFLTAPGTISDNIPSSAQNIPGVVPQSVTNEVGTFTAAIDYTVNRHVSVYFTARSGFKPGGFNAVTIPGDEQYSPENVLDYEIGAKGNWQIAGVGVRGEIDMYTDEYGNIQRSIEALNGNVPEIVVKNVAKARIQGIEGDLTLVFSPAFDISMFYSGTDAKYTDWPNGGGYVTNGVPPSFDMTQNALAGVPKNQAGVTPQFHLRGLNADFPDITLSANVSYQSKLATSDINSYIQPQNYDPGRTLVNLRFDWRHINESHFSVGAAIINLTNYQGQLMDLDLRPYAGIVTADYYEPMTFYFDLHYDW